MECVEEKGGKLFGFFKAAPPGLNPRGFPSGDFFEAYTNRMCERRAKKNRRVWRSWLPEPPASDTYQSEPSADRPIGGRRPFAKPMGRSEKRWFASKNVSCSCSGQNLQRGRADDP